MKRTLFIAVICILAAHSISAQNLLNNSQVRQVIQTAEQRIGQASRRIGSDRSISWDGVFLNGAQVRFGELLLGPISEVMINEGLYLVATYPDNSGRLQPVQSDLTCYALATTSQSNVSLNFQIVEKSNNRILATWTVSITVDQDLQSYFVPVSGGSAGGADFGEPDSLSSPRPWPGTGTIHGLSFSSDDDGDYFLLDPSSINGNYIDIQTTNADMDTYIEVYDRDGYSTLMTDDDGGEGLNARVSLSVDMLPAILKVRPLSSGNTGSYSLIIETMQITLSPDEPNNSIYEAYEIDAEGSYDSQLMPPGDEDYYQIDVPNSRRENTFLTVETISNMDTTIRVYDRYQNEVAYNDDGGEGMNARVQLAGGQTYYVQVSPYGSDTGNYSLAFSWDTMNVDRYEPDNSPREATQIELNSNSPQHNLSPNSDYDYYTFNLRESTQVSIETSGDIDTYMYLYDENDMELSYDDDGGRDLNARIDMYLERGRYYIKVEPLGSGQDDNDYYSLQLRTLN